MRIVAYPIVVENKLGIEIAQLGQERFKCFLLLFCKIGIKD